MEQVPRVDSQVLFAFEGFRDNSLFALTRLYRRSPSRHPSHGSAVALLGMF